LPGQHLRDEARNGIADFGRRVLRQEMRAFRHLLLVGPRAAEFTLRTDQESSGIAVDEQPCRKTM
jgi:hypothetical protein